jgi:glycine cleavage system H protein
MRRSASKGKSSTNRIPYRRCRFSTRLPLNRLDSPLHVWLLSEGAGIWRVGFTKFATRLLGETIDHGWKIQSGQSIRLDQTLGWLEGFKSAFDLTSVATGTFLGTNPELQERIDLVSLHPMDQGWLYRVSGTPDPRCVDARGYTRVLNATLDRLLADRSAKPKT